MPKKPNALPPVRVDLRLSPVLASDLEKIVATGYFGNSKAEVAERLLVEALRNLIKEGTLIKKREVIEL
jgi:hypothetical protein